MSLNVSPTFFDDAPAGEEKKIQRMLARLENDISARISEEAEIDLKDCAACTQVCGSRFSHLVMTSTAPGRGLHGMCKGVHGQGGVQGACAGRPAWW